MKPKSISAIELNFGLDDNTDLSQQERKKCIKFIKNTKGTMDETSDKMEVSQDKMEDSQATIISKTKNFNPNPRRTRKGKMATTPQSSVGSATRQDIHKLNADRGKPKTNH